MTDIEEIGAEEKPNLGLWSAFVDAYGSTRTRRVVDRFLRAVIGAPRDEDSDNG